MKRMVMFLLASAIVAAFAAAAIAQTTDPGAADKNAPASPGASANAPDAAATTTPAPDAKTPDASAAPPAQTAPAQAAAPAGDVAAKSTPAMDQVKERGMKASAKERTDLEKKIDEIEKQVENESTSKGEAAVAGRIAGEFGLTADALTAEKQQYSRGYGELLVAHTLFANAKTDATIADLFALRTQGTGWGVIAAGLDLKLGDVVPAVRSEGRVAMGLEKGDGKTATIHLASAAKTKSAAKPAVAKGEAKAGASAEGAGLGVGGGVDVNKATGK